MTTEIPSPVTEGDTTFTPADPAGVGATLDRHGRAGVRRIIITGPAPDIAGCRSDAERWRRWLDLAGRNVPLDEPYIGAAALRARYGRDGGTVSVTRAAQWFGESAEPAAVAEATKHVRHVAGTVGAVMTGSPSRTGLAMLHATWKRGGHEYRPQDDGVQEEIRATSGQGRFELLDRGRRLGTPRMIALDAEFAYARIASTIELPVGDPVELAAGEWPSSAYAPAWLGVTFTPSRDLPFGLLPVREDRGWSWPTRGRKLSSWATGAEVAIARQHGYRIRVERGYYWPTKRRVLGTWAETLMRHRRRVLDLPLQPGVADAVRTATRNIAIQTIGILHGRDATEQRTVIDPREIPDDALAVRRERDGAWRYELRAPVARRAGDSHPEWTAQIWGVARARLARQMLVNGPRVIAVALDSVMLDHDPHPDSDKVPGEWRVTKRAGRGGPFTSMSGVYAHMDGARG